jgi:cytochrome b561
VAALILVQFVLGWLMPDIKPRMQPGAAMSAHIFIGLVILTLILVRFVWRNIYPVAPDAGLVPWQRITSTWVHNLLSILVLATTLTGWIFASMRGWEIVLIGLRLPQLVATGSNIGNTIGQLHAPLTWVLLAAIGLHVISALAHLFIYRDRIMQRMWPSLRSF